MNSMAQPVFASMPWSVTSTLLTQSARELFSHDGASSKPDSLTPSPD